MADISQIFPPELLAEVLEHTPARDVLRFKQVRGNCSFSYVDELDKQKFPDRLTTHFLMTFVHLP